MYHMLWSTLIEFVYKTGSEPTLASHLCHIFSFFILGAFISKGKQFGKYPWRLVNSLSLKGKDSLFD